MKGKNMFFAILIGVSALPVFNYFNEQNNIEDFIPKILFNNQEIETLKSVVLDGISEKPFGDFIQELSNNVTYKTYEFENKKYVAVNVVDPGNPNSKKIIHIETALRGDLIYFDLKEISSTEDGKRWITIDRELSCLLLFTRSIFSITHSELKILEKYIGEENLDIYAAKQCLPIWEKILKNSPNDVAKELKLFLEEIKKFIEIYESMS